MSPDRIPLPDLERLTDEQKRVADDVARGPRGEVRGPVRVWLHSPELASRAQKMGEFLRWHTTLEPRISELVILATARHYGCHYIWFNHVKLGLDSGLLSETIDSIKNNLDPDFERHDEATAFGFAKEMLRNHAVGDTTLAEARRLFGNRGVVELGALIGHYHSGAIAIELAAVQLPDGTKMCLP